MHCYQLTLSWLASVSRQQKSKGAKHCQWQSRPTMLLERNVALLSRMRGGQGKEEKEDVGQYHNDYYQNQDD